MTSTDRHDAALIDWRARVERARALLGDDLTRDVPLKELAETAHFSPFHFHRVFKAVVGETVARHVRRLRLERAAVALGTGDRDVLAIALDVGYGGQEAFTRAFKARFGVPPAAFRRLVRACEPVPVGDPLPLPPDLGDTTMEITVQTLPARRAVSLRHVGPYNQVTGVWQQLCFLAMSKGLFGPSSTMFGLSHDDPESVPAEALRYDACLATDAELELEPPFAMLEVPEGEYAVVIHEGPYERLAETYGALYGGWLPTSGRAPRDAPCVEVYLNDPSQTAPEDLRTQVCVPVTAASTAGAPRG
jgi:AraC family transcriptional regulator